MMLRETLVWFMIDSLRAIVCSSSKDGAEEYFLVLLPKNTTPINKRRLILLQEITK
jgi:hypothetical protein